jgi:hypothetical protein
MPQGSDEASGGTKLSPTLLTVIFVAFPFGASGVAPALFSEWEHRFGSIGLSALAVVARLLAGCAVIGLILLATKMLRTRAG